MWKYVQGKHLLFLLQIFKLKIYKSFSHLHCTRQMLAFLKSLTNDKFILNIPLILQPKTLKKIWFSILLHSEGNFNFFLQWFVISQIWGRPTNGLRGHGQFSESPFSETTFFCQIYIFHKKLDFLIII